MLPGSRGVDRWTMSMVNSPEGDDHAAADAAGEPGPGRPGRAGTPLPDGPAQHPRPHPPQIARLVRASPDTVRRVLKRYLAQGPDAVPHRPHPGQPAPL